MHTYRNETEGFVNTDTAAVLASGKNNSTITNSTLVLMGATGAAMIVSMSVHNILLGGLMIATALAIALPKQSQALLTNFEQIQRKYGVNLYAVLFTILTVVCVLDFAAAPADAQFFNNAQTWMTNTFGNAGNGQTQAVVELFFNVLRGLFLLYVGISLVRIVQAARNDEDWQTLARTPLIIVLSVFVGDLVTGLITGA
ncbi:hypothetical protein COO91_10848 (plasmid) [Nostoc flagelliforme CCNUN1]|uniref:Uncharacterized protein n=1 Tax=Nostoc flagelliforme CCNUN1 TaxID=2038116 RepID=A0A2K8TAB6_9NOSO|nr:hypothetical protein [Nostoc flagelliforme]AUB44610.1 hypothetical protein COO91_10848 [Nostoc flagelliforme CCNUN1]